MAGIAGSGADVHNGPTVLYVFEEAGLATGFFVPVIWALYESTAKSDALPFSAQHPIITATVRQPGSEDSALNLGQESSLP